MVIFVKMQTELSELVRLVRQSERYCTTVAERPDLATADSHGQELLREQRIAELSAIYGIN